MFGRKLAVAGIAAFALTPGVALACMGDGSVGAPVSHGGTGATGATGMTGGTGSTGYRDAEAGSNTTSTLGDRRHHFRHGHQFHGGEWASRS